MSVLVDTGILVAGADRADRSHERAARILATIGTEGPFTTDHILVECWHLIRSRASWFEATRFWEGIRESPLVIEFVGAPDLERAEGIAVAWADQEFDLADCTSFAVMERVGCSRVASFDRDFAIYRYGADRTRSFQIVN